MAIRVIDSLFLGYQSVVQHPLGARVIACQLPDPPLTDQVDAAVTGVRQMCMYSDQQEDCACRSHATTLSITICPMQDRAVGFDDRHIQSIVDREIRLGLAEKTLADSLDSELARDLAAGCPPHTIGYD